MIALEVKGRQGRCLPLPERSQADPDLEQSGRCEKPRHPSVDDHPSALHAGTARRDGNLGWAGAPIRRPGAWRGSAGGSRQRTRSYLIPAFRLPATAAAEPAASMPAAWHSSAIAAGRTCAGRRRRRIASIPDCRRRCAAAYRRCGGKSALPSPTGRNRPCPRASSDPAADPGRDPSLRDFHASPHDRSHHDPARIPAPTRRLQGPKILLPEEKLFASESPVGDARRHPIIYPKHLSGCAS